MSESKFAVVYFKQDNTYSVIVDSKKIQNKKKAQIYFDETQQWFSGEIVFRGSEKKCQNYIKFKLGEASFLATDCDTEVEAVADDFAIPGSSHTSKYFVYILCISIKLMKFGLIICILLFLYLYLKDEELDIFQKELDKVKGLVPRSKESDALRAKRLCDEIFGSDDELPSPAKASTAKKSKSTSSRADSSFKLRLSFDNDCSSNNLNPNEDTILNSSLNKSISVDERGVQAKALDNSLAYITQSVLI